MVLGVVDSSRYFVIKPIDGPHLGLGFADRSDSFDLNMALNDHFKSLRVDEEIAKEQEEPRERLDLAFKEGQTIKVHQRCRNVFFENQNNFLTGQHQHSSQKQSRKESFSSNQHQGRLTPSICCSHCRGYPPALLRNFQPVCCARSAKTERSAYPTSQSNVDQILRLFSRANCTVGPNSQKNTVFWRLSHCAN